MFYRDVSLEKRKNYYKLHRDTLKKSRIRKDKRYTIAIQNCHKMQKKYTETK